VVFQGKFGHNPAIDKFNERTEQICDDQTDDQEENADVTLLNTEETAERTLSKLPIIRYITYSNAAVKTI
jgi:hypothetical protein